MAQTQGKENTEFDTLKELIIGIVFWAFIGQAGIFFLLRSRGAEGMAYASVCWWLGVMVAVIWAVHMCLGMREAFALNESAAVARMRLHVIIRYTVALTVMVLIYLYIRKFFDENMLIYATAYVPGIMMLKFGAYIQPLVHRIAGLFRSSDLQAGRGSENMVTDHDPDGKTE
ncbi:MAG: hypothetical protein IKR56_00330 [Lachnospiraceae bacterium]|nr:hypothetical protein [Lachnospiraceae bacterium]MBR4173767.1 hypothetical protein [Lachnospiraceae bacterium]